MIPIPAQIRANIIRWLPKRLPDTDYPTKETDNIIPDLITPAITYYFSSAGASYGSLYYRNQWLRTVWNKEESGWDDYWGGHHYATLNVVLRSKDKDELSAMWTAFVGLVENTRRNLIMWVDGARFVEILNSKPIEPARLPDGSNLFWAQVDLRFEYEQSYPSDADYIKRVHTKITVDDTTPESNLFFDRCVRNPKMFVEISAMIVDSN